MAWKFPTSIPRKEANLRSSASVLQTRPSEDFSGILSDILACRRPSPSAWLLAAHSCSCLHREEPWDEGIQEFLHLSAQPLPYDYNGRNSDYLARASVSRVHAVVLLDEAFILNNMWQGINLCRFADGRPSGRILALH